MPDIFLSYSREDQATAQRFVEALEAEQLSVWWDRTLRSGEAYDEITESALRTAKVVVVLWSKRSVTSRWVRAEATLADRKRNLMPVMIEPCERPIMFELTQTAELAHWTGDPGDKAWQGFLADVRRLCPAEKAAARQVAPFVAREAELARLTDLLERAKTSAGALVLISGEAGVGKSRLVKEVEARARGAGMLALTGRCLNIEGAPPYQPLLEQTEQAARLVPAHNLRTALGENAPELAKLMPELRQQFPDIAEPVVLPPDQERRYLMHGCGEYIDRAARMQPMLLVYEDLQWAGESTCRMLRYLAERLRDSPVLMVGVYRDTDLDPRAPFSQTMHELLRERLAEDITLTRLDAAGVAALLESRAGQAPPGELVALIFAETEGNPFFVEELYRHLDDNQKLFAKDGRFRAGINIADTEVPKGVRLIIEHRLAKVSDACRKLLTAAAVAGRVVGFDLLARIGDLADEPLFDALEEAEGATLLEEVSVGREARYQFVHEQIRQTLVSDLSLPRRQRLHLRIADALEGGAAGGAAKNAGEIGFHLYQAGAAADPERTAGFLVTASQRAIDAVAFEDALRLLDMAVEVVPAEGRVTLAHIQSMRATALRGAARIEDALGALAEGLALGEDLDAFAELLHQRAALLVDLYRAGEALADLERLLTIAQEAGDKPLELTIQRLLADAHYKLSLDQPDHAALAREACERTIELARAAGDKNALARALILSAHFVDYWADYRTQVLANLAEAKTISEALKDEDLALDYATMSLRASLHAPEEFEVRAERVLARLEARRDPIRTKEHLFWMIGPTRFAGHLERSVEVCDRAIELAARLDVPPVQYHTFKALGLVALGRYDQAWEALGLEVTHGGYRFGAALQRWGYFHFKCQMGAIAEVLAEAEALIEESRALNRVWMVGSLVEFLAVACARAGRTAEAQDVIGKVAPESPPRGLAAAHIALATGDAAGALEKAQQLSRTHANNGNRLSAADAGEVVALSFLALQRFAEARDEAARQIAFCEERGYRNLLWRLLATRAEAHAGLGSIKDAMADFRAGAALVKALAATIPVAELSEAFVGQVMARQVLEAAGG